MTSLSRRLLALLFDSGCYHVKILEYYLAKVMKCLDNDNINALLTLQQ